MSRWKVESRGLDEYETRYTARFRCTNIDTSEYLDISVSQAKHAPASDLVGSLRALAQLVVRTATEDESQPPPGTNVQNLN